MDQNKIISSLVKPHLLKRVLYFDKLDSTNKYATSLAAEDDTLVIAGSQEAGLGRFRREWVSGDDDIAMSLVKSIKAEIDEVQLINFYTSYTLLKVLKEMLPGEEGLKLKWPNDILVNGKKISGILIEMKDLKMASKRFIIGIGVNVNTPGFPEDLSKKATSLQLLTGKTFSREDIIIKFIESFYYDIALIKDKEKLISLWKESSGIIDMAIGFKQCEDSVEKKGKVIDINTDGGLKIENELGEIKTFYSGEISLDYENFQK